jgi:hypothetical protein
VNPTLLDVEDLDAVQKDDCGVARRPLEENSD